MPSENLDPAEILILGATSLIGRYLVPMIPGAAALSRREGHGGEVRWVRGDLDDPDLIDRLPRAATVLALSPIWLSPQVLPALKARGMTRLVAFSSTSRFTKTASPVAAERDVAQALIAGEEAVRAFCQAQGVAWTILRPTLIYAEGQDRNVSRLAGLIRRLGFAPLSGDGAGLRQPVHAQDLAAAALAAAASPAAHDQAYDLAGAETLTYRAMVERIFHGLGRRPRILSLPAAVWRLGLTLAGPLLPGATAGMGARMDKDLVFDCGPAARDFGWAPRAFRPVFDRR